MIGAPSLPVLAIAAGIVAILLFALLYVATGHPSALVAGCGGGALLLVAGLALERRRG